MIDIGIASWNNPFKLDQAITHLQQNTVGEFRLLIVDNASTDPMTRTVIDRHIGEDHRITAQFNTENKGYAGAVNDLLRWAQNNESHYLVYCDNDCDIQTLGWDEKLIEMMERHHEIGMIFPRTFISYPIQRDGYIEILWGIGCFWLLNLARLTDVGFFDENLGHQEEVDFQQRLRLAGYKSAAHHEVGIYHAASATTSPDSQERINQGVIRWVDKWNTYYHGPHINYFSPNVTRFEDWNALYLEEYNKQFLPADWNDDSEQVTLAGKTYDVIKVLRHPHLYRDRII